MIKMRTCRKLSKETKLLISKAQAGKKKSEETKLKISESLKKYWESIPYDLEDKVITNKFND